MLGQKLIHVSKKSIENVMALGMEEYFGLGLQMIFLHIVTFSTG